MEKIKINNNEFELLPMGVDERNNKRILTISSPLNSLEIKEAFSDVSEVTMVLNDGQEITWLDGVRTLSITDHLDGTYTVEISTDIVERQLAELREEIKSLRGE